MSKRVYALLVGINEYPDPRARLEGCVNDIRAMEAWLRSQAAGDEDLVEVFVQPLLDEQAGRDAVIAGFREHLTKAQADDVALFYFSGHGSQQPSRPEFWHLESDRVDETLVCWDSRTQDGHDLADKELAALIAEVAKNGAHVLVILDSCHSGSGSRGDVLETRVRRVAPSRKPRSAESYLFDIQTLEHVQVSTSDEASGWRVLPYGKHVLLAACADEQEAKELPVDGRVRGAFSYYLQEVLGQAERRLTYWNVISRVRGLISGKVAAQIPQLEAADTRDFEQPFLGGVGSGRRPLTVRYDNTRGWVLDAGAAHAVPLPGGDETTRLALFDDQADTAQLQRLSEARGEAMVLEVATDYSTLRIDGIPELGLSDRFRAVVTSLPMPPVTVRLEGEAAGLESVRAALAAQSPYVRSSEENPDYRVIAANGEYVIARPADDRPLVEPVTTYTEKAAVTVKERLEHIARWELILRLRNPGSAIPPDAVELLVYRDGVEVEGGEVRLTYGPGSAQAERPSFTVAVRNTSEERLYCAVLALSEAYAVDPGMFPEGGIWVNPRTTVTANNGTPLRTQVPDTLWAHGVTERRDWLKLVVSREKFDASRLQQGGLEEPKVRQKGATRSAGARRSTLNRLMDRVQRREIETDPDDDEQYDDWTAQTLSIVTVRPRTEVALRPGAGTQSLGAEVKVVEHPHLQASARLTTIPQMRGDVGPLLSPPILRENPDLVQPLQLTRSRGQDPGLSVLELSEVTNGAAVTADEPLVVELPVQLAEDEYLLPVAFDGEFFLPLGHGIRGNNVTLARIERLPDPVSKGRKSLTGSIRILFHKLVSKRLGRTYEYPILAAADLAADGITVEYEKDPATVRARVETADDIVLCVHGIIGDTRGIVASVCGLRPSALVLSFDYENLNTTIDKTAVDLRKRLADVGLVAGGAKRLQVVAHSMGGLACRYFVEHEQGKELIRHLVLLGTPNAGSPWPVVQDWAMALVSIGLNGLASIAWPAEALTSLMRWVERTNVTLEQMEPGSDFLTTLATSSDPGIPYTLICGNTSLRREATEPQPGDGLSLYQRLMRRVLKPIRGAAGAILNFPFGGAPNDIAVSVESMCSVGPKVAPAVSIVETACDHVTYFNVAASLEELDTALRRGQ